MGQQEVLDFETHVTKAKEIIDQLNSSTINLKEGMQLYKDAQAHIHAANTMLEEAEFELKNILEQQ